MLAKPESEAVFREREPFGSYEAYKMKIENANNTAYALIGRELISTLRELPF
jgi:hypothetical protein